MLKEGVWVRRFSTESRSRYKLGIDVGLEGLVCLSDAVTERLRPLTILIQFSLVRAEILLVELTLGHSHEIAHIWPEFVFESREVNVSVTISIKHVFHQQIDIALGSKDLILSKMGLEVLVGDETITIAVKCSEDMEGARLARAEGNVFDLIQEATESLSSGYILDFPCVCRGEILVYEGGWWVGALAGIKADDQFVGVFLKDERSKSADICGSMAIVLKSRQEALEILFG